MDKVLVGTFHKTGTLLVRKILSRSAEKLGYKYWQISMHATEAPAAWDVGFQNLSRFPQVAFAQPYRGAVVIRDPRDVIISGAHYHCKASEDWLHRPHDKWDGKTYQQVISSFETNEDKFLFEMQNTGKRTIESMMSFVREHPEFATARFEDLTTDPEMAAFRDMFTHLGFSEEQIESLLTVVEANSIFSGRVKPSVHVRSGRTAQWKSEFSPRVLAEFERLFPGVATSLGYEGSSTEALAAA